MSTSLPDMDPEAMTGNKVVRTFRMPVELVHVLGREASRRGLDLTALVLRVLHGYLTYFSLPDAAIMQLEADREAMGMDRSQYLSHVLYHRCLAIREQGPGHDDPRAPIPRQVPAPAPPPPEGEPSPARSSSLDRTGGGAHDAVPGLVPGGGVWPYGVRENRPRKR